MKNNKFQTAIFIFSFFLTSCAVEPNKEVAEEFKAGQAKFHLACANCHGSDAEGGNNAPSLIHENYHSANFSDEKISWTILNGSKSGAMPSLKGKVSKEEIQQIIDYLRYSQKENELNGGLS